MSKHQSPLCYNELYFFHEYDWDAETTTTRVFFTEFLDPIVLECDIKPSFLDRISSEDSIGSIEGFPHFVTVRWLHVDVTLGLLTMRELEKEIKHTLDIVLTNAFGWESSVIRKLSNDAEVRRKAAELHVDWSRGQKSF